MTKRIFISVLLLGALCCCEKAGDFTPASEPSVFTVALLDTFRVETSTLLIDSIVTTDITRLLAGSFSDSDMGEVRISTYFKLGPNSNLSFENRSMQYDSIYLSLRYDGYASGNEDQTQRFTIREVLEEYGADAEDQYYDFDRLTYSRASLGTFDYDSDWEKGDSIAIRLSDELGRRLFEMAEAGEVRFSDADFERSFEGLALVPELGTTGQVVGFTNSTNPTGLNQENAITLRMYYHETGEFTENFKFDFEQTQRTLAFNGLEADRDQTMLAGLTGDKPLYATEADNKTFIQAATGIQTKIRFPSLDQLNKLDKTSFVNRAVLRLEPLRGSYQDSAELPDSLAIYLTDKYNEVGNVTFNVSGSASLAQYAQLEIDAERGLYAFYEFDVTEFVLQQLRNQNQNELALLAAPTAPAILGGVEQMRMGGDGHLHQGVTLQIYLTKLIE